MCPACRKQKSLEDKTVICAACHQPFLKHSAKTSTVYCSECKENGKAKIAEIKRAKQQARDEITDKNRILAITKQHYETTLQRYENRKITRSDNAWRYKRNRV